MAMSGNRASPALFGRHTDELKQSIMDPQVRLLHRFSNSVESVLQSPDYCARYGFHLLLMNRAKYSELKLTETHHEHELSVSNSMDQKGNPTDNTQKRSIGSRRFVHSVNELITRGSNDELCNLTHRDLDIDIISSNYDSDHTRYKPGQMLEIDTGYQYNKDRVNMWVDLTNIEMSPVITKRRTKSFSESVSQMLTKEKTFMHVGLDEARRKDDTIEIGEETSNCKEGCIHFKFQYLIITERLKVTVLKVTHLLNRGSTDPDTYVQVSLMPRKIQKQVTKTVKGSRNPYYMTELYFNDISLHDMHLLCLRLKVMTKRFLKPPSNIGEVVVSLEKFDLVSENYLVENVNARIRPMPV